MLQGEGGRREIWIIGGKIDASFDVCKALLGPPWPRERDLDSVTLHVDLIRVKSAFDYRRIARNLFYTSSNLTFLNFSPT